jgi:phosphoserine aminotransferase
MTHKKPSNRPSSPNFSCGPCKKHTGWSSDVLKNAAAGRSHRSNLGRAKLKQVIDEIRELLNIPDDYQIAIMPGSDTCTVEAALWSLLGPRPVDVFAWEVFGQLWLNDCLNQLSPLVVNSYTAERGQIADLSQANPDNDIVFTWNGTTGGVITPNADWIDDNRSGLVICDAVSSIFAIPMSWNKLDVVTFSWQKVLGGEAQHGMIVLSPKAIERLRWHTPTWPIPKIFRLAENLKINPALFEGETLNTPSMLCVEDVLDAMTWARSIGGTDALHEKTIDNFKTLKTWVDKTEWIDFLCEDEKVRSPISVCLKLSGPITECSLLDDQYALCKRIITLLEKEDAAYDINAYAGSPPGFRIWCGPTVDASDIATLTEWLDWGFSLEAEIIS